MQALSAVPHGKFASVSSQARRSRRWWWCAYSGCLVVTLAIAQSAWGTAPHPFSLAFLVVALGAVVAFVRPVAGVYLTVAFAMAGDAGTAIWYPFTKNLSSRESILFVSDQLVISPLEIFIGAMVLGWVLGMAGTRRWTLERGRLFWPLVAFTLFLLAGLAYGLGTGGDRYAALWELRPILYLPALFILITNLLKRPEQYRRLYWLIMIAVTLNGVIALLFLRTISPAAREGLESLGDHTAAVHSNALLVLIAATWLLGSRSWGLRSLLPFMAIPVVWAYLVSERRAGIIALLVAMILLLAVLHWRHRRLFWAVAPIGLLVFTGYVAAFWSSTSLAGFPAQAVKTVVAPDEQSESDQASDYYRVIENYDVVATIQSEPITGVGFGQKFLRPIPLPEISDFLLREYMPHNSILWVWMKTGIGGFIALLFLFGTALRTGGAALVRLGSGTDAAITLTSVAYVVMFAVFTYVDISWDARSMVFLAVAMANIDSAARVASPAPSPPRSAEVARAEEPVGALA